MAIHLKQYLDSLKELQGIDSRLAQLNQEIEETPVKLSTSGADYLALAEALKNQETEQKSLEKEKNTLEKEFKDAEQAVQEREKRLYAIKTQKEYQATLKEIAKMKQENKVREERILTLMEIVEKKSQEMTQLKSEVADKEGGYRMMEQELKKKEEELVQEREGLRAKRPMLLEGLPDFILKEYEGMKRRYANPIAAVIKGVCRGCSMNIPPQFYNEMLRENTLKHCPHCHRLIYVESSEEVKKNNVD